MAALLVALVGCNKEPQQGGVEDVNGKVYMKFTVNMLTTRSGTDVPGGETGGDTNSDASPDYEVGKDYENKISTVDIVLTNDTEYVVTTVQTPEAATGVDNTYIASFNSRSLVAGNTYNVYIYANCSAPETKNLDATSSVDVSKMTEADNFWMTNAYNAGSVKMPDDMSAHTQPNNPLNLGTHYVERSMARFDYSAKNEGNAYEIKDDDNVTQATITLTEAALINHSKSFYMLRRVSDNGLAASAQIGGIETPLNYVVDTDSEAKKDGYVNTLEANFDAHMNVPSAWNFVALPSNSSTQDNWGEDNQYYIWQYAKENTIPGIDAQEHGITTGIVFKGEITGAAVTSANDGAMIFVFENTLYGDWNAVENAAGEDNAPATLVSAVNKVKAKTNPTAADYAGAGFTGYAPAADGKYYAYYYYWNRHNDNGQNDTMGVMEFAVVRNNVYKLSVDKIMKFGHPDPNNPNNPDPDPEDPNDPDEELNYYFNVTVKVLPWVVRVNHIEF